MRHERVIVHRGGQKPVGGVEMPKAAKADGRLEPDAGLGITKSIDEGLWIHAGHFAVVVRQRAQREYAEGIDTGDPQGPGGEWPP